MKRIVRIVLVVAVMLLTATLSAHADRGWHGHGRHGGHFGVGVVIGPGWGGGWWPSPYYPYYPYYPYAPYYPYYTQPPVVVEQPPDVYVQPSPETQKPTYWYYCPDPQGYYPYVKKCPNGWMKVVPPENGPTGPEEKE